MTAVHGQQHYARWVRERCRRQPAAPGRLDRQEDRPLTAECTVSPDRYPKGTARKTVREERIDGRGEGCQHPGVGREKENDHPHAASREGSRTAEERAREAGEGRQAQRGGQRVRWPERAAQRPHREQGEQSETPPARGQMGKHDKQHGTPTVRPSRKGKNKDRSEQRALDPMLTPEQPSY